MYIKNIIYEHDIVSDLWLVPIFHSIYIFIKKKYLINGPKRITTNIILIIWLES